MTGKTPATAPKLPWKTRLSTAAYALAVDAACRPDGTVNRFFMNLIDSKVPASSEPSHGVSSADITVDGDPSRNLWFRLYLPSDPTAEASPLGYPVVFYFHGGGFAFFSPDSKPYDYFCRTLARGLPAVVISVNYRLLPEHRYPAQYDDGFDVLKFIDDAAHVPDAGDPTRCFLAGDSAGGNLAHHVALRAGDHEFRRLRIVGLIAIQPFFGGEEITESEIRLARAPLSSPKRAHWMWKAFLPEGSDRDHPAANVFGPRGADISPAKFPAAMVVVGGFDALQDWQKRYCEGLRRKGIEVQLVEYANVCHGFYGFPELPEASMVVSEIKDFVQKQSPSGTE